MKNWNDNKGGVMRRIILLAIMVLCIYVQNAFAFNLNIESINKESGEATLIDRDTENEWVVTEGDEIEGWIIMEINDNNVLIKKEAQGNMPYGISKRLTLPKSITEPSNQ